jgi:methylated-DNA-[protein]-cysteine S-methyltransferase
MDANATNRSARRAPRGKATQSQNWASKGGILRRGGANSTAARRAAGKAARDAGDALAAGSVETALGRVYAAVSARGVVAVSLPGDDPARFRERAGVGAAPPTADPAAAELLHRALSQIQQYCAGKRESFDLPLDLRAAPFTRRVLVALAEIPFGTTHNYGWLAARVGSPRAARAVGTALSKNPIPLLLPCHRIVASTGIGGFAGKERKLDVKRRLLQLERAEL